jgi:hypothetical protein
VVPEVFSVCQQDLWAYLLVPTVNLFLPLVRLLQFPPFKNKKRRCKLIIQPHKGRGGLEGMVRVSAVRRVTVVRENTWE